jgi:dihydroxyacetone kinase-like predicted kinase
MLAALLAFDPEADVADNITSMQEAAARVSWGEVARSGSRWDARAGGTTTEYSTLAEAVLAVVERLVTPDSELVTILSGDGSTEGDRAALQKAIESSYPSLVTELHDTRAPARPYVIGVE